MSKSNYNIRTDCFAYKAKTNECNALKELYCRREDCKFYESKENYIKKLIKEKK